MFHEVRAERDGTVSAILVASGQEVEAGQELMRLA
jgi:acetyl-CoA carboxylase biotin carboxyl carrier protein